MDGFEEIYRQHFAVVFRFAIHCAGRRELADLANDYVAHKNREPQL
jgi:hypothetical protein